jgi:hypothetical protein
MVSMTPDRQDIAFRLFLAIVGIALAAIAWFHRGIPRVNGGSADGLLKRSTRDC